MSLSVCCELQDIPIDVDIVEIVTAVDENNKKFTQFVIQCNQQQTFHRFSHFYSLYLLFCNNYPLLIIPPIPHKKYSLNAKSIQKRQKGLKTFLKRITTHPVLKNNHLLHRFLTENLHFNWETSISSKTSEFYQTFKKALSPKTNPKYHGNLFLLTKRRAIFTNSRQNIKIQSSYQSSA